MLKRQLFLIYILSLIIPISLIGAFLLYNNYSMLYGHYEDMLVSDNLRVRSIMFEVTTSITNVCDIISENDGINTLIQTEYKNESDARKAVEQVEVLSDLYTRYTEISSIQLYTDNESLTSYNRLHVIEDHNRNWYEAHMSQQGYYWSTFEGINQYNVPYRELQLIHPINLIGGDYDALLVITISNNYLKNRIDNNDLWVDLTVEEDRIFFSTAGHTGESIDFLSYSDEDFFSFSGTENYMGELSLLEVSAFKPIKTENSLYIFSKDPYAFAKIERIQLMASLILLIGLVVPTLVIVRYTKQLTNRVDTLRTEMHRVTGGDYNIIEHFKGNDELVDLFNDLQVMIHSIKERDQAIFEGKMKEQQLLHHQKETEFELLASKINPHFLYNTLETIRMKAFAANNKEVAKAVKLLGKYMRYNLESTGELTTLESELNYINIYLSIQKLRFGHRIDYDIRVDDSLDIKHLYVLPLLIQPLVENALSHGHEETLADGIIQIRCVDKGATYSLEVEDNGSGISEEKLSEIYETISGKGETDRTHFGLYNIHQRLQLYYGSSSRLVIETELFKGTCFKFEIPKEHKPERMVR